jgi:hypothetical protein
VAEWRNNMAKYKAYLLAAILVVAAGAASAGPIGGKQQLSQSRAVGVCRTEEAANLPSWVVEGAWDRGALVLADVLHQRLVRVSKGGVSLEQRDQAALEEYLMDLGPVGIRKGTMSPGDPSQTLIELANGSLVPLDRNFLPRPRVNLATARLRNGEDTLKPTFLFDWVLVEGEIVGYGDIEGPGPSIYRWKNGFVRYNLNDPTSFRVARERTYGQGARAAFRLAYPFLAGIGGTAYAIVLDGTEMGLWRFARGDKDLVEMDAFPKHLKGKVAPPVWDYARPEEFPLLMADVERFAMPTGLYSWEGSLFIVSRSFEEGRRIWYLSKINPATDTLLWTVPIPGSDSAHHMTVIPGPDEWAFLEKGPVTAFMEQATNQILSVNSSQIRAQRLSSLCR